VRWPGWSVAAARADANLNKGLEYAIHVAADVANWVVEEPDDVRK